MKLSRALFLIALLSVCASAQVSHNLRQGAVQTATISGTGTFGPYDVAGFSSALVTLRGTYGGGSIDFQVSPDGAFYFPAFAVREDATGASAENTTGSLTNTARMWKVSTAGQQFLRIVCSALSSGSAVLTVTPIADPTVPMMPAGGGSSIVALSQYSPVNGRLPVDGSGVTQPISGTVTANLGTIGGVATDRTTAAAPFSVQLSDGSAFYIGTKTGQLPSALDGSGFLKTHEQGTATNNLAQIGGNSILTGGSNGSLGIGGLAASGASQAGNPVKIGGPFNTTQPTVTNGQMVDAQMTARGAQIVATGADTFNVTVNAALPSGSNVIGALTANQSVNLAQIGATSTVTGGVNGSLGVGGLAAHNASPSGNPETIAGYSWTDGSNPTATTAGNVTRLLASTDGRLVVTTDHPKRFSASVVNNSGTTLTQLQAAPGAGLSLYITDVAASSSVIATTTADQFLELKSGTGSNCATGTAVVWAAYNLAFAPIFQRFATPIKVAANSALCWIHAATGSKTFIVNGYIAP